MNILSKRSTLAIAAVVDVALFARNMPVGVKSLAARHDLPPRHLEGVLQGLVHAGILKGVRGPRGGYALAREPGKITAGEIVRTVLALSVAAPSGIGSNSELMTKVVEPSVRRAVDRFLDTLDEVTVDRLCAVADAEGIVEIAAAADLHPASPFGGLRADDGATPGAMGA
ncbi:MAG: Rrf2 family transcriptional regulator [Roseiarcus sp.]|jgi:Rrf2 family protein